MFAQIAIVRCRTILLKTLCIEQIIPAGLDMVIYRGIVQISTVRMGAQQKLAEQKPTYIHLHTYTHHTYHYNVKPYSTDSTEHMYINESKKQGLYLYQVDHGAMHMYVLYV
jgi:hypothetical protein